MAAKISGIKIPVTIDSSGVDAGISNLKSKLTGVGGGMGGTTLSTGTGSQFGAGPFGPAKSGVGGGLMGQVIASRIGAQAAINPFMSSSARMSLAWAQATGNVHTIQIGPKPPPISWKSPYSQMPAADPSMGQMAVKQLLGLDFGGALETAGAAVGASTGALMVGGAAVGAGIFAGKKLVDYHEMLTNMTASVPAAYSMNDPYQKTAYDLARKAQMTEPKGKAGWWERFAIAQGEGGRNVMDTLGTAIGNMFSGETIGYFAGGGMTEDVLALLTGDTSFKNTKAYAGHEDQVYQQWRVRNFGSEKELRDMRRANRKSAAIAERTAI